MQSIQINTTVLVLLIEVFYLKMEQRYVPERHTASKPGRLYAGCRVSRIMGPWHKSYVKTKHDDMVLYGTVIKSTGYRRWSVTWDDGQVYDDVASSVLTIHNGDGDGLVLMRKKPSSLNKEKRVNMASDLKRQKTVRTKTVNDKLITRKKHYQDPWASVIQGIHASPSDNTKETSKESDKTSTTPAFVTPSKRNLQSNDDKENDTGTPFSTEDCLQTRTSYDDDLDSDESLSQHTCHPTDEDLIKANNPNVPNDCDGSQPEHDPKEKIPRDINTTDLQKWKDHTMMMLGKQVKIKFDKNKFIYWEVEDIVEHCNVHQTQKKVDNCDFVEENVQRSKINPVKDFFRVFPIEEMKICVENFNRMVMHEISKSLKTRTSRRQWRYKNDYFKELTLREFQVFIGLIYAASTRAESGINLWRVSRTGKHYLNAPANFGQYMNLHRFKTIRKWFHFCFAETDSRSTDPWYKFAGGVNQYNRIRKQMFPKVRILVLDESMCGWCPRTTKHGGLPHLTFQKRKPVSLGTELKISCCGTTGMIISIELQRGKKPMKFSKYNAQYGHCTGQVLRCIESVKNYEVLYENPKDCMSCMRGPIIRTAEFHRLCEISDKS